MNCMALSLHYLGLFVILTLSSIVILTLSEAKDQDLALAGSPLSQISSSRRGRHSAG